MIIARTHRQWKFAEGFGCWKCHERIASCSLPPHPSNSLRSASHEGKALKNTEVGDESLSIGIVCVMTTRTQSYVTPVGNRVAKFALDA